MSRHALSLPLARDPSSRFIPWIVGFMVFLAVLALAVAMAVANAGSAWRHGLAGTVTIQILPRGGEDAAAFDARTRETLSLARREPGVARAELLPQDRVASLLEPWLGQGASLSDLPLPRLIDVTLSEERSFDAAGFAKGLTEAVPGTSVDSHGVWLRHLTAFARAIELTAAAVVALISLAAIAVVVFATRSGLAVHRDAIEILHLIGARDGYIAREFQVQALWLGLKGGLIGLALAGATLALIYRFAARIDAALVPDLTLTLVQLAALAAIPLAAAVIGMETARRTVIGALARLT
jgi:cell division transport system permease protein